MFNTNGSPYDYKLPSPFLIKNNVSNRKSHVLDFIGELPIRYLDELGCIFFCNVCKLDKMPNSYKLRRPERQ